MELSSVVESTLEEYNNMHKNHMNLVIFRYTDFKPHPTLTGDHTLITTHPSYHTTHTYPSYHTLPTLEKFNLAQNSQFRTIIGR